VFPVNTIIKMSTETIKIFKLEMYMSTINNNFCFENLETSSNFKTLGKTRGRPTFDQHEKLLAKAVTAFVKYKKASEQASAELNIKSKSNEEADLIRMNVSKQKKLSKQVCEIDEQLIEHANPNSEEILKRRKNQLIKEIRKLKHDVSNIGQLSVGKPKYSKVYFFTRAEKKYQEALQLLHDNEREKGYEHTSQNKLSKMAEQRLKSRVGREKNTELDKLDNSIKKVQNKIIKIQKNMLNDNDNSQINFSSSRGRKKHGEKEINRFETILEKLYEHMLAQELLLSKVDLAIRRVKKSKRKIQGLKIKQYSIKSSDEMKQLQIQLFEEQLELKKHEIHFTQLKQLH